MELVLAGEKIPSSKVRAADALDYAQFVGAMATSIVELEVHCLDPAQFRGSVRASRDADTHVFQIESNARAVIRTDALIDRAPDHYYKFMMLEEGETSVFHVGREATLAPGDMVMYATNHPYTLLSQGSGRVTVFMFPQDMLRLPPRLVRSALGTRIDGQSGMGAVVRPFLSGLGNRIGELDAVSRRRMLRQAVSMVSELIEPRIGDPDDRHAPLRSSVVEYVDTHLSDPDLAPAAIAAAHFVSLRQLYSAFEGTGANIAGVIRERRLQRCYRELSDSRFTQWTTAAIGRSNGFLDAAHFSRVFKSRFGVAPSQLRDRMALRA